MKTTQEWIESVEAAKLCNPELVCDAVLTAAEESDEAAQVVLDAAIANDSAASRGLGIATSQQISISIDGIWAGSGQLRDGTIENCGAQFCDDNDKSLAIYDQIEAAIDAGKDSLLVTIDGESRQLTWSLT